MAQTVLVLGASGLFGGHTAKAFAAAGWTVRKYQRGTDMVQAAQGADLIVNGLNPPNYHAWDRIIPEITAQVIATGLATGVPVLVPVSVYNYGTQPGPWGPDTPQRPVARKGAIRVQMEADYRAASERGLKVILLRGGDFIDPQSPRSFWNMIALKSIAKGKITSPAPAHVKRAYAYLPDMARVAVALAERCDTLPAFTDTSFAGFSLSMADLAEALERLSGKQMRISPFMWWAMRLVSPVLEVAREMMEMRYLWNHPHTLDPAPLKAMLPDFQQTPLDDVLRQELAVLAPTIQGKFSTAQTGQ
ncbi:MAG: epimerase [Pseudorhodobacter sp.]|nr:epimerase [Pseudorhodobacter sp.]